MHAAVGEGQREAAELSFDHHFPALGPTADVRLPARRSLPNPLSGTESPRHSARPRVPRRSGAQAHLAGLL